MTVTIHFHGASGTVTGSCYRVVHPEGAVPRRLRHVPGQQDRPRPQLQAAAVRRQDHRLRAADARPYRPLRPAAQAQQVRLPQADLDDRADRRALLEYLLPDAAGIQESEAEFESRKRGRKGDAPAEALYTMRGCRGGADAPPDHRLSSSGSSPARASARATGTPATSSAPPRSRSTSRTTAARPSPSCSRAISGRTKRCSTKRRTHRRASTTSSANPPMAAATARLTRSTSAARS